MAYGAAVRGPQWRFTGSGEVVLPARYAVAARDPGELLLHPEYAQAVLDASRAPGRR